MSVSVGLAGDIRGIFAVESEMATATGYAAALGEQMGIPLEDPDQFGVMHRAALSELVNQMSGRATIELSGIGLSTDITPPTVMTGDDIVFTVATGLSFVEFEVTSTVGRFVVALGFQD